MMNAIEQAERDVKMARELLEGAERKLEEVKKQQMPCPLEEGEMVTISNYERAAESVKQLSGYVQVEKKEQGYYLCYKFPFGHCKEQAEREARRALRGNVD